jgi:organic hydroperoxide reductase OsmC/OhrA
MMEISANVRNAAGTHQATVRTGATTQALAIAAKTSGRGSAVNGGELLMLALATCYCNDLYREANRLGIAIDGVEVEASAEFPGIGLAATNIRYRATVSSTAAPDTIARLLRETDAVAEIHNTVRAGVAVTLEPNLERRRTIPTDPAGR